MLIESAEPGASDHPDLTYARARRHNPRLVYCAITAYGGLPRHAGRPSHDALVAARTGLQWEKRGWPGGSIERVNGVAPFLPDLPVAPDEMEGPPRPGPLYSSVPWPSISAFHLASMGIGAALHARERTGQGCCVTTSLLQGALVNGTFTWQRVAHPERPGYRMWVTDPRVPHGFFRTGDGRWIHHWTPQPGFVLNAIHEGRLEPTSAAAPSSSTAPGWEWTPRSCWSYASLRPPCRKRSANSPRTNGRPLPRGRGVGATDPLHGGGLGRSPLPRGRLRGGSQGSRGRG